MTSNTPPSSKKSPRRRQAMIAAASIIGAVALISLGYYFWPTPMPAPTADREQIVKFAATDRFAKLPPDQKKAYTDVMASWKSDERREAVEKANLSDEDRRKAFGNAFGSMMRQRIDGYFAIKDPREQRAFLDKMIDEFENRRAEMEKARAARPSQNVQASANGNSAAGNPSGQNRDNRDNRGDRPGRGDPARQKGMLENHSPEDRAKMAAFFAAMQKRREERGLPEWQGPRGR